MKVINSEVNSKILTNGYRKFTYKFSKIIFTILLFPLVYYFSKKYQKIFFEFCFSYQREGIIKTEQQKNIAINSFEYYYYDCKIKNLTKYDYPINIDNAEYQEFTIKNNNNQDISCLTIRQKIPSEKWVIGFHGWTENKYLGLRLVTWFYQQGYNVLTFDSMAHGKSYGQYTDIGLTTANDDVASLIKWVKENHKVKHIGMIGNSMGASTINYYLLNNNNSDISWAITDCGFTNLLVQYRFVMQYRFKKPWWLMSYNLAKNYQKYSKSNIKNYDLLAKASKEFHTPTLMIHGKNDEFVPFFMSNVIYQTQKKHSYKNYEYLFLAEIGHVESLFKAHEIYINKISKFINKCEKGEEILAWN